VNGGSKQNKIHCLVSLNKQISQQFKMVIIQAMHCHGWWYLIAPNTIAFGLQWKASITYYLINCLNTSHTGKMIAVCLNQ